MAINPEPLLEVRLYVLKRLISVFFLHANPSILAMNDLLQTMAMAGGPEAQWAGSSENLDGAEAGDANMTGSSRRSGQRMKELAFSTNAIDCATLTLPSSSHSRAKHRLQVKGQDACLWKYIVLMSSLHLVDKICSEQSEKKP